MNRLWVRLTLSFIFVTSLVIAVVAGVMSYAVETNFSNFLNTSNSLRFGSNMVNELKAYYRDNQSWENVGSLFQAHPLRDSQERQGAQIFIASTDGTVIYATNPDWVGIDLGGIGVSRTIDLMSDGEFIGILGEQTPGTVALNQAETEFLQDTATGLLLTTIGGGVLAITVAIVLSRNLTKPLRDLTTSIEKMTSSDLGQPIYANGTLEVALLANAFTDLSIRLGDETRQKQRMTADIAHELRTPITIMRGHLEAMMDGIYPMDAQHLAVAYDQILHLTHLVEDMRLLTRAEAGQLPLNKAIIHPADVVKRAKERFQPLTDDANVTLNTQIDPPLPMINVDVDRIQQALDNLMTNALRHTNKNGSITLSVAVAQKQDVVIRVHNTGTPIPVENAKHIFDRFWRADDARERDVGGTGLGLAITKLLIEVHDGQIRAIPMSDGTTFEIQLPASA